jgi:hypothetical protein
VFTSSDEEKRGQRDSGKKPHDNSKYKKDPVAYRLPFKKVNGAEGRNRKKIKNSIG